MRYYQFKKLVKLKRFKKPMVYPKAIIEFTPHEAWNLYKALLIPNASFSPRVLSDFHKSFITSYEKFNIYNNLDSIP